MNELDLFASLRPHEPTLWPAERAALRDELFGGDRCATGALALDDAAPDIAPAPQFADGSPSRPPSPRGPSRRLAVAAGLIVALGVGGVWAAVAGRDPDRPSAPAQSPAETAPPSASTVAPPTSMPSGSAWGGDAPTPPRVTASGWTLTRATDAPVRAPALVVFDPARRFDGPWLSVERAPVGQGIQLGGPEPVAVGATTGTVSSAGEQRLVQWVDADGTTWWARGWQVERDAVVAFASGLTTSPSGSVTAGTLPPGMSIAPAEVAASLGRSTEYELRRPDGTTVQLDLYPGGPYGFSTRVDPDEPGVSTESLDDEQVTVLAEGDGRYRADVTRGFWTWELDGAPFDSARGLLDVLGALQVVDEATWRASLPTGIVAGGDARHAAVQQLLADVPLPDGFTIGDESGTADRYQLIAQTATTVVCGWLQQWTAAGERGDATAAGDAVTALATAHHWAMLLEIADEGQFSDGVWTFVDGLDPAHPDAAGDFDCRS